MYARKLTKDDLLKNGITEVTADCKVFKGEEELEPKLNNHGYYFFFLYDLDKEGKRIKVPCEASVFGYVYKQRSVGLHRLMWAWFNDEVPSGMVVDHISNKHDELEDYKLDNLQLLTPAENIRKNRELSAVEISCKMARPRSYYENKLEQLAQKYEAAKKEKDTKKCHRLRALMYQYRAKLRYWDSHAEEHGQATQKQELIKELRKYAACAKCTTDKRTWHYLLDVIKNKDDYTNEQLEELIKDMDAWTLEWTMEDELV